MKNSILIISSVWPEPQSSAAGSRMMQLITMLQSANFDIHYASTSAYSPFSALATFPSIKTHTIAVNDAYFQTILQEINPNTVLYDRFMLEEQFGWTVRNLLPNAMTILDTEDLHFLRKAREKAIFAQKKLALEDLQNDVAKREIASIYRCDITLIIATHEMELLQNSFQIPASLLFYLPLLFTTNSIDEVPKPEKRKDLVFIGNFLHKPNLDAVQQLKTKIWPVLKTKLPNMHLKIYGAYPTQQAMQWHQPEDKFHILGRANEAQEVLKTAKLLLAPLRFGAGIKGKILEAMYCGTPVITTDIGAEGIPFLPDLAGSLAQDNTDFITKTVRILENQKQWQDAQSSGFSIIENCFLQAHFEQIFLKKIQHTIENLITYRQQNFIGNMLHHHLLKSTEYMSRWIMEKNKNITAHK